MNEKEEFYDNEIAPKLLEISKLCADNGLNMVAMTDWGGEEYASTVSFKNDPNPALQIAQCVSQAGINIDELLIFIVKKFDVSQSIFLSKPSRNTSGRTRNRDGKIAKKIRGIREPSEKIREGWSTTIH